MTKTEKRKQFLNVADMTDPHDAQGRTYRQINSERKHAIQIGTLVELENGVRLFVVQHTRDCDQEPLYTLGPDPEETEMFGFLHYPHPGVA